MLNQSGAPLSKPTLTRLPSYLNYFKRKQKEGANFLSSAVIAHDLNLTSIQVRKDLSKTGCTGKPKAGFDINELVSCISEMLGYNNAVDAVLIGAGQLGKTLLSYGEFSNYGLNIVAAFDTDNTVCGTQVGEKPIFPLKELKGLVKRLSVHIGIITVPAENAQSACDLLIDAGILAIWNFAPTHLTVPEHILVQNENMAASLAVLSQHLAEKLSNHE